VKSSLLFVVLMLHMLAAGADSQPLITITDPAGDDYGAGTLIYPQRSDFEVGDLDILQMQIRRDKEGVWFEATFKNPIRDPGNIPNAVGAESLAEFARKGFYQFNIDIYVDTDRVSGSGNTFTLPGRHVGIDQDYAWEKAVILTPRPELMRQQLLGAAAEQFPDDKNVEAKLDKSVYFPTRIQVRGKLIAFFVPASFFFGSDGTDWAITGFVTGAVATIRADFSLVPTTKVPLERIQLGVMQPAEGLPRDTFGYSGTPPGPVVDLLGGTAEQQVRELTAMNGLTGVAWGSHAANVAAPVTAAASSVPAATASATVPVDTIGKFFLTGGAASARPVTSSQGTVGKPADQSITQRLQTLQQLYDQKLIDEGEYREQKQRILKEL